MDQPEIQTPIKATDSSVKPNMSSIGELIKNTLKIYMVSVKKLLGLQLIAVLGVVPIVIVFAVFGAVTFLNFNSNTMSLARIVLGLIGIISIFVIFIFSMASQIGQMLLLKNFSLDRKVWDLFKEARPMVWGFFIVSILTFLIVILGFIALIIPGIYLAITYLFSLWAYVFENKHGMDALRRSKELVTGYRWNILGRFIILYVIGFIISIIFQIPLKMMSSNYLATSILTIIYNVIQFIIAPAFFIYFYLVFKDLIRIKGESKIESKKSSGVFLGTILIIAFIVVVAIPTLAIVSLNKVKEKARDAKRISDITQMQTALKIYFNEMGSYSCDIKNDDKFKKYMITDLLNPTPVGETCKDHPNYEYKASQDKMSYEIDFCLENNTGNFKAGVNKVTNSGN